MRDFTTEAGEGVEVMPGSSAFLTQELETFPLSASTDTEDALSDPDNLSGDSEFEWRPQFLIYLLQNIETLIATAQLTKPTNPLVERFKYNVISSSLLSPDLPAPHSHGQTRHHCAQQHSIPGNLPHSRTSSELSQNQHHPVIPTSCSDSAANEAQFGLLSGLVVLFAVLLNAGLTRLAILTLWTGLAGIYYLRVQNHATRLLDLTPCLQTLDDLISANTDWETIIQEVVTMLERDERTLLSSSISPQLSSLRVALHSTLQTTQTQCDNVRHLLSALTSPSDLSQLSEMYAPPSPYKQNFSFHDIRSAQSLPQPPSQKRRQRPMSIPTPPSPSATMTSFTDHKRMTWNGPHNSGSFYSNNLSSMTPLARRRTRHRSDLSALLGTSASTSTSMSAPVTPAPSSPLARVSEDVHDEDLDASLVDSSLDQSLNQDEPELGGEHETTSFGAAALKLNRNRAANGFEAFSHRTLPSPLLSPISSPPRFHPHPPPPSANSSGNYILPISPRSSFVGSSRFTAIHTSRQPLSLSALRHALQAAIGAKRYACAHLLALRFREEDSISVATPTAASMALCGSSLGSCGILEAENTYWDDVRSIMELLIGALSDATSRLCEALREAEAMRLRDQTPTPVGSVDLGTGESANPEVRKLVLEKEAAGKQRGSGEMLSARPGSASVISFAPMPSQFSRFAGHVAALQSALDDARGYLEECVNTLNDPNIPSTANLSQTDRTLPDGEEGQSENEDHPALRAFEKLRRELGFVLRECERGRNRLLDLVKPPQLSDLDHHEDIEGSEEGTPGLGHDSLSEESDKADHVVSPSHSEDGVKDNVGGSCVDVNHLPPAHTNAEQVFEADTSLLSSTPIRPKSRLSREERIRLVKARRESGLGPGMAASVGLGVGLDPSPVIHGDDDNEGGHAEKWGPGGDVVQELKDVIWKVGERRRKVQSQLPTARQSQPSPSLRQPDEDSHSASSIAREPSLPSSLDTPNSHSVSDSPVLSPKPRRLMRASMSSLSRSPESSLDFSPSLIPRRTSLMNMRNVLENLQREVSEAVGKDIEEEDCVLSTE
ncbi:hypothetical protein NP233_g11132 [Leucocoprinus birnbaumii]|uniref:Uncharacterized protein n=1 Tax=Leucocoprinus birnbaumii TaxID=56174 RepID=A0AAD5VH04_9AGAR|nr:hypothetical protein NP233_g11132 [Leucocoprinus birnbaumii]